VIDVVLVQPPVTWLSPSLALALLKSSLNQAGISSATEYGNHLFARMIGREQYNDAVKLMNLLNRGWEILFAGYAGFEPAIDKDFIFSAMEAELTGLFNSGKYGDIHGKTAMLRDTWEMLNRLIPEYIDLQAGRILSHRPKIVGFTVMTQQRNASFALIRELKKRNPSITTVLGGGICTGRVGELFLQAVPELDYVYTGEGDLGFAEGCRLLLDNRKDELPEQCPWFLGRGQKSSYCIVPDLEQCPEPDYSDYVKMLQEDPDSGNSSYLLTVESSRGCWWRAGCGGCRFCGLHYCKEAAAYRCKSPQKFWAEIDHIHEITGGNQFQLADCIISRKLINALPQQCPEKRRTYAFFAECRTDLSFDDLQKLYENGFRNLQPGVESLQDDFLNHMNKGRSTIQHLLFLKYCRIIGITPAWNILLSLPGDRREWYEELLDTMGRIHHLKPPVNVNNVLLARGSIYADDYEQYGLKDLLVRMCDIGADPQIPGFSEETADYFFSPDMVQHTDELIKVNREWMQWKKDYSRKASLEYFRSGDGMTILDGRSTKPVEFCVSEDAGRVLELADEGIHMSDLEEKTGMPEEVIAGVVDELDRLKLVYRKNGEILNLAIRRNDS